MYSDESRLSRLSRAGDLPDRDLSPRDLPLREKPEGGCGYENGGTVTLPEDLSDAALGSLPIAMAYVPPQKWREILEPDAALREGTQFRELALHFTGNRPGNENRGGSCRG